MNEQKKEEQKPQQPKMRQIIIETDGNKVIIIKHEVAGVLELKAILRDLLENLK